MLKKDNQIKIHKKAVDKVTKEKPVAQKIYWDAGDGSLKGFGVCIQPSGIASYCLQYRSQEGRSHRITLGRTNVLTPDEARQKAREYLVEVNKGGNPIFARKKARKGITVKELCDLYLLEGTDHVKPTTVAGDRGRIEAHIKPLLGNRAVSGLEIEDIEKFQSDVANGKTAKPQREKGRGNHAQGGRSAAARTLATLSIILSFACRRGVIKINPALSVKKYRDKKRDRFLSHDELKALGKAMDDAVKEMRNETAINAIKALLLTGCRRNEVLKLPKAWVDYQSRCIRFGDTKTGAQVRPIGQAALALLKKQSDNQKEDGRKLPWLFPSDRVDGHFVGLPKVLGDLCARAELKNVSIHTLRHTFSAIAAELGYSELTIAGLIGHRKNSVTSRYAHVPDSALLSAADRVSAHILASLEGRKEGYVIQAQAHFLQAESKTGVAI